MSCCCCYCCCCVVVQAPHRWNDKQTKKVNLLDRFESMRLRFDCLQWNRSVEMVVKEAKEKKARTTR
jgi:hypothetical protein